MANKVQIRKFLEKKREEAVSKLKEEGYDLYEKSKDIFFDAYSKNFSEIKEELIKTGLKYDSLIKSITDLGLGSHKKGYGSPVNSFNELIGNLSIASLKKYYVSVTEAEKIKERYKQKVEETTAEYNSLIAICQANNSSESIKILENICFNTSEIEVKKEECTVLVTNIDTSKLLIVKEAAEA